MRLIVSYLTMAIAVVNLAGCSAEVSGGSPVETPKATGTGFFDPKPAIVGPLLEGHWISDCRLKPSGKVYRKFDLVVAGEQLTRTESRFTDSKCQVSDSQTRDTGRFRFIDVYADTSYNIEYAFDLGDGKTIFPQEKILLADKKIFLSDFVIGEMGQLLMNEPLFLNGIQPVPGPVTGPAPVPVPQDAILARNYTDAKYAFCETQGRATLLYFNGFSFEVEGSGSAKIARKNCGAVQPLKWEATERAFKVILKNGKPQVSFPQTAYSDRIEPYSYQSGLEGASGAYSIIGGNSGECFFLKSEDILGVPFTYECY